MVTQLELPVLSEWAQNGAGTASLSHSWLGRAGKVLHPSPLSHDGEVQSLNITRGCMHACAYCCLRGNEAAPAMSELAIYKSTAELLDRELKSRRKKPKAVYLSPASDPFPPMLAAQQETLRVLEVLARHDVQAWIMTRGWIKPSILLGMLPLAQHIRITIGLTTLGRSLQRRLEPLAGPPRMRLRQIAALRAKGFKVQVALEPLLPGLTDTRESLAPILKALAADGVRQVSVSYAFLREGISRQLEAAFPDGDTAASILEEYKGGPILTSGGIAGARYLPRARRQRGYAAIMCQAAQLGIRVSISATTNPDFSAPRPPIPMAEASLPLMALFLAHQSRAAR